MIRPGSTDNAQFLIRQIPSPSDQNSINNGQGGLPKSVLEYIFLAFVVFIIICIILRRYHIVKSRQRRTGFQPSATRRYRNFPRQVELRPLHPDGQPYPTYPNPFLREIPAAYIHPPSRRTRARDIDPSGRRQDISTEMDHDGELGANESLPAYDNFGGPPKYFELDRNRPPLSGIAQRPDVSWETLNNNTSPENVGVYTPVGTTHATQVSQPDTSHSIPPYFEHSSSNDAV